MIQSLSHHQWLSKKELLYLPRQTERFIYLKSRILLQLNHNNSLLVMIKMFSIN
jgi:hypothetical protein